MSIGVIIVSGLAFAIGLVASVLHTRRRVRAQLADRLAREAERRIAAEAVRRLSERHAQTGRDAARASATAQEKDKQ